MNGDYFNKDYKVYISTTWQSTDPVLEYENIEDYYHFIQVNEDMLDKTVDRTIATLLKWGNSSTQIMRSLTDFGSNVTLRDMLNSMGTEWENDKSAILIPKSKAYLWKNEEILQKHLIISNHDNTDNHYQIINKNLPGYQLNPSNHDFTGRIWGEYPTNKYTPFDILAYPISFIGYETSLDEVKTHFENIKYYIVARISNQYKVSNPDSETRINHDRFVVQDNRLTWPEFTIRPSEQTISYEIFRKINNEWSPTSLSNLSLIKWTSKSISISVNNTLSMSHTIYISLPKVNKNITQTADDLYTNFDWQLNDTPLPLVFDGYKIPYNKTDTYVYYNHNDDILFQISNSIYNQDSLKHYRFANWSKGYPRHSDDNVINSYAAYPPLISSHTLLKNLHQWLNTNIILKDIQIPLLSSDLLMPNNFVDYYTIDEAHHYVPLFSGDGDRYLSSYLIRCESTQRDYESQSHTFTAATTVNASIPILYSADWSYHQVFEGYTPIYNTMSMWYSTNAGSNTLNYYS